MSDRIAAELNLTPCPLALRKRFLTQPQSISAPENRKLEDLYNVFCVRVKRNFDPLTIFLPPTNSPSRAL